jgi:hypothetical protein
VGCLEDGATAEGLGRMTIPKLPRAWPSVTLQAFPLFAVQDTLLLHSDFRLNVTSHDPAPPSPGLVCMQRRTMHAVQVL